MKYQLVSCVTGLLVVSILFGRDLLKESGHPVHETSHAKGADTLGVRFKNSNEQLGIDFNHRTEPKFKSKSVFENIVLPPAEAVYDLNFDGFPDIVFSGVFTPVIYLNVKGRKFIKASVGEFGFNKTFRDQKGMLVFSDLNNDGITDLILQGWPHHSIFLGSVKNNQLYFDETNKLDHYKSHPDAVNVLDFNQDGRLDIIFGNFTSKPGEKPSEPLWLSPSSFDNVSGGTNEILEQEQDGSFTVRFDINFITRSYTHSTGIGDLNRDGFPDLFFANDYSHDELFMNDRGLGFKDVTNELIPIHQHGNSGMNGEVLDYNDDGLLDIYVTNIYKPPGVTTGNLLWEQLPDGTFKTVSKGHHISRCGFSWAAKFADIDNDAQLDLLVTNGRNRAVTIKEPSDGESLWYRRHMAARIPNIFRQFYFHHQLPERPFYISAFEEHCLFHKRGDSYVDIAVEAGITDTFEGRGLAIADFNNDGLVDFVNANVNHPAILYMNHSVTKGNWLGIELKNKKGNNLPIGAKITLTTISGRKIFREYYPANGYRAQSDWRLHYGLGKDLVKNITVEWPMGKKQSYEVPGINRYLVISEDQ